MNINHTPGPWFTRGEWIMASGFREPTFVGMAVYSGE